MTSPKQLLTSTAELAITLTERDLNLAANSVDTYAAGLEYFWYSFDDSPKIYLELTETGVDTALFTSTVALPSGGSARPPGSRLTVTYMDPDIGSKGAVRNALNTNPSTTILSFGADGAHDVGGFSLSSAGVGWRSSKCPSNLMWAAACGPTPACKDEHLCGSTMTSLDAAGEYRLAAGSALTVTVKDLDQNKDSISTESMHVTVRVQQSDDSLAAYGNAQNPYCSTAYDQCYLGSAHGATCTNDGDCAGGGSCVKRGCSEQVRRREEQASVTVELFETGANTALFSGIIHTRDTPHMNAADDKVVNVGVGDTMSVTYSDSPSLTSLSGTNRTRLVKILKAGRPARLSCPSTVLAGGRMKILLTDPDLTGSATALVQIRVMASNGRLRSDEETLQMTGVEPDNSKGKLWGVLQVQFHLHLIIMTVGFAHWTFYTGDPDKPISDSDIGSS